MDNFKIFDLDIESVKLFKDCFDANGSPKKRENIEWQFFDNTVSSCFVDIAYDEKKGKTAGIYAVSGVKFKVGSEEIIGTQSLDTITDINYRGKGLFTVLSKSVYNKLINSEIGLVYGFPNGNSIHGFEKKLDWNVLDPLPFLIKPLKSKYFTDRIKALSFLPNIQLSFSKLKRSKNFFISEENVFPKEVNIIWERFSANFEVAVVRDRDYLNWRYVRKPNQNYRIAHCHDQNNEYVGFVVFTTKEKHNGKIGYIMELIYDPASSEAATLLMNHAVTSIKSESADCILAWCLEHSPSYNTFKKDFFVKMPEKIRPIELHFGARCFNSELKEQVYKRENWYLSYSDSDTV
jgi:hypothetical protein